MKVLIWTQYFWPERFHINDVAANLHKEGIEVTVLTGKPNYPQGSFFEGYHSQGIQHEIHDGIHITRVPIIARKNSSAKHLLINYLSFILSGYFFAPLALRKKKFDIIFIYAPSPILQALPAIFISFIKKAKIVLWVQDIWPDVLKESGKIKGKFSLFILESLIRYIYKYSDLILVQSEKFRSSIEKLGKYDKKIYFHPNSSALIPKTKNLDLNVALLTKTIKQNFSIVFAGNIGASQSCGTIIEAADALKNVQDITFYLVGEGRMQNTIAQEIKRRNLTQVFMPGPVSVHEMIHIYESASALLLTLRDKPALSKTIPSRLQSYMAAGKPIIACSNGAAADIVDEAKAGISCPAEDALALSEAILHLYHMSQEKRTKLGENSRTYFMEHFYLPQRITDLMQHFKNLINMQN